MKKSDKWLVGFTLIEIIIVLAIFGILAAVAIPSISAFMPGYRLDGAAREMIASIQQAKIRAVKHNTQCVVEFTPGAFTPAGGVGSYRVFMDTNGDWRDLDGSGQPEEILVPQTAMPGLVSLYSADFTDNGNGTVTAKRMAGFNSHGLSARSPSGAFVYGEVKFRNRDDRYRKIAISPAGHVTFTSSTDGVNWN